MQSEALSKEQVEPDLSRLASSQDDTGTVQCGLNDVNTIALHSHMPVAGVLALSTTLTFGHQEFVQWPERTLKMTNVIPGLYLLNASITHPIPSHPIQCNSQVALCLGIAQFLWDNDGVS